MILQLFAHDGPQTTRRSGNFFYRYMNQISQKRGKISFSYIKSTEEGKQYFGHIIGGINFYLLLKKQDDETATLTGANSAGVESPLPIGYTMIRVSSPLTPINPTLGLFIILWAHNYVVSFRGRPILKLSTQRQQTVSRLGRGTLQTRAWDLQQGVLVARPPRPPRQQRFVMAPQQVGFGVSPVQIMVPLQNGDDSDFTSEEDDDFMDPE